MIGASVWIASTSEKFEVSESIERWIAETTPTPSESSLPNGLPIAATGSPTDDGAELPSGTGIERVVVRIDLEQPDVVEHVPADDLRRDPVAILELDVDPVGRVDRRALRRRS